MNDVSKSHIIELDKLSLMMLGHYREHAAAEPPQPTEDHDRFEHEELAAAHYEWSQTQHAIRLLLGVQLVRLAVDQIDQRGDVPG